MICKKTLCIELKSNLICGSGEGWGNIVDSDSIHDEYGFPYIPARRIKGLLKEAAMELEDFQVFDKDTAKEIFGSDSSYGHHFALYNGYLKNYDHMREEINNAPEEIKKYLMPVNVNNHYTEVHYHTAIDEDGIAKEHSLRSVRAIDKGLIFYAPIEFEREDEEKLEKCMALVRHMGMNRTRGYGEVKLSLIENEESTYCEKSLEDLEDENEYTIKLYLENQTSLSITGTNGIDTLDYISGSSIMGFFANRYLQKEKVGKDFYRLFLEGNVIFHNAYISDSDWREYIPSRKSIYKQKTGKKYYDKSFETPSEDELLSKVNNKYLTENELREVKEELVYHHRRPDKKEIGHVISNENQGDGMLYQREVISKDQRFIGRITGKGKDIKKALLNSIPAFLHLGSSCKVQYGNVKIEEIKVEKKKTEIIKKGTKVVSTLISPLLLVDEKGESIVNVEALGETLKLESAKYFVDYTEVSGYNAKWKLQKPFYIAFDKGSCVQGILKEDIKRERFEGILQNEGLGEIRVDQIHELPQNISSVFDHMKGSTHKVSKVELTKEIVADGIKKKMRLDVLEKIKKLSLNKVITPSLLGRLLKMLEKNDWKSFQADYLEIAQEEKKSSVKEKVDEIINICDGIIRENDISSYIDIESYRSQFYIQTLRDLFTQEKVNRREV